MSHLRLFNHYISTPLVLLGFLEVIVLSAAIPIGCYLRFGSEPRLFGEEILVANSVLFAIVMVTSNLAMGVYSAGFKDGLGVMAVRTLVANCLLGIIAITVLYYIFPQIFLGRGVLALATISGLALVSPLRLFFYYWVGRDSTGARLLVVGAGDRALALAEQLEGNQSGVKIVGFVGVSSNVALELEDRLVKNTPLLQLVKEFNVDEVVVAMDGQRASDGGQIPLKELLECKQYGTRVNEAISVYERELGILEFTELKQGWMVFGNGFGGSRSWDLAKRFSDIVIASILVVLLCPLILLAVLMILAETGRPVLYSQERVGLNGKVFRIYKFRSMTVNAESDGKAQFAQEGDTRVTRMGAVLRNTRMDELPQLYNVLRGDMSFVGPRPERPEFVSGFDEKLPFYNERHAVKPGLMGWAQLNYPYGASMEDAANKLRYDLYYVKNRSLILDLSIMIQTVQVILLGTGVR